MHIEEEDHHGKFDDMEPTGKEDGSLSEDEIIPGVL